jgi:hypothetical protein
MPPVTIAEIDQRLRQLPPGKLPVVYDFVSYLLERDVVDFLATGENGVHASMLASEAVLRRDWDLPRTMPHGRIF